MSRWRQLLATHGAGYLVPVIPFAVTLATDGPRALAWDGHWLQRFEALLMLWVGVEVFRCAWLKGAERVLYAAGAAWLATDETLMVHECAKWKFNLHLFHLDPLIAVYAAAGAVIAVRFVVWHPNRRAVLIHGAVAVAAAVLSTLADAAIITDGHGAASLIIEEGGEFVAIAAAVSICRVSPRDTLLPAVGWVAFCALWIGGSIWLIRPWLCPARLL